MAWFGGQAGQANAYAKFRRDDTVKDGGTDAAMGAAFEREHNTMSARIWNWCAPRVTLTPSWVNAKRFPVD